MPEQRDQFKGRMSSSRRKKKNDEYIDKKPSVLQEDASTEKAQISGFLQTKKGRAWKRNWYVLKDHVLFTFKATNDKMAIETMPVLGWTLDIRAVSIRFREKDIIVLSYRTSLRLLTVSLQQECLL